MSEEDVSRLFDSGVNLLNQAKSDLSSPAYGDSLTEAKRCLDQVIDLAERDDPSFDSYVHTWATINTLCLAFVDYSPYLDSYLASSSLIKTLNNWFRDDHGQPSKLSVDEQELDDFWAGIGQIQDERYCSLDNPSLLSPGALGALVDALGEAISRSSHNASLSRIWNLCRSVALYLKLDVYNPSEISLCISSLSKAVLPDSTWDYSPSNEGEPFLLEAIDHILHNPQIPFRQNSLRSLATFYAQRQLSRFNSLWSSYRANSGGSSADLDDAIAASFEGILWTQDAGTSPIVRFDLIFGYACAAYERFNQTQRLEDLQDSVEFLRELRSYSGVANEKMAAAGRLHASISADLGYMLSESNDTLDWEKSLTFWRQSVALTEPDAPDLAGRLFELGNSASKLYGISEDYNSRYFPEARDAYERAAIVTTDISLVAQIYFELASLLYRLFVYTATREDLYNSMCAGDKACELVRQMPSLAFDDPYWSGVYVHCVKLIKATQGNFKQDEKTITEQLELAIELCQLITSRPHYNRPLALSRLGLAYMLLARVQLRGGRSITTDLASNSLQKALDSHQAALEETRPDHDLLHARQSLVGTTYYQMSGLPGIDGPTRSRHLDSAAHYLRLARLAGKDRINLNTTVRLTKVLEDRYNLLKQRSDLDECVSLLLEEEFHFGRPRVFLDAATQLVRICHEHSLHEITIPAYKRVLAALRKMTRLGLSSTERQDGMVYSVGHACDAAASALKNNQVDVAVELLEDGRNLFFSQLLPIQTDTTLIRLQDPDLASDLDETLGRIRQYHRTTDSTSYHANQVDFEGGIADDVDEVAGDLNTERIRLLHYGQELERLLVDVRKLPGLSNFMAPKPFSDLKQVAQLCPVVYLNISQFRCDALIIGSRKDPGVLVVPLPTTSAKILTLSQTMRRVVVQQGRGVRQQVPEPVPEATLEDNTRAMVQRGIKRQTPAKEVQSILHQLWELIVRPVLLALGYLRTGDVPPSDELPHICWCPSGPSAIYLPLHAAGDYARGEEHCAMTHVISTYTPTLSSLLRSLERESHTDARDARLLLVSQPASPPNLPLSGVVVERDKILATFEEIEGPGNVTSLHDDAGRVEEVVKQLPSHEMLHLACHGIQDMVDPLESSVILFDGQLSIREIIKTPLPRAELVYLSACQTATGSISTPDESFSLAGSLLFAGYRGAVATMWSINDGDGRDVATSFYKHILQREGSPAANAAWALHCAVKELREANPGLDPIRWIPFVYFGIPGASNAALAPTTVV